MQGKLEKFGSATDADGEQPETHKVKAMRELDENIIDLAQEKMSIFTEID